MSVKVPDSNRIGELWLAIKTLLAGKLDVGALDDYSTTDAVAISIAAALTDYAKKSEVGESLERALSEYMKASEVNAKIAETVASLTTFKKEVLDALPGTGEDNVIYLVPNPDPDDGNSKLEYMWIDGAFELIGSTKTDLTNYWSKDDLEIMTEEDLDDIIGPV